MEHIDARCYLLIIFNSLSNTDMLHNLLFINRNSPGLSNQILYQTSHLNIFKFNILLLLNLFDISQIKSVFIFLRVSPLPLPSSSLPHENS